jgi:hypothetical protein
MKKLILLAMFIACLSQTNAQSRIGLTFAEIKSDFPYYSFTVSTLSDGSLCYSTYFSCGRFVYFFKEYGGVCVSCAYYIDTYACVNSLVEKYNSKYVIVSDVEWKAYVEGGNISIKLTDYDGLQTFLYY